MMWEHTYGMYHGFGSVTAFIISLMWWLLIVAVVISVFRWLSDGGPRGSRGGFGGRWSGYGGRCSVTALDILKERYAKGEIDKQEFEEKKKDLSD